MNFTVLGILIISNIPVYILFAKIILGRNPIKDIKGFIEGEEGLHGVPYANKSPEKSYTKSNLDAMEWSSIKTIFWIGFCIALVFAEYELLKYIDIVN